MMQQWAQINISQVTPHQVQAAMAVTIAIGTLYCFLGCRVLHFIIALTGFLLAGLFAAALAGWASSGKVLLMAIGSILGGCAGAVALYFVYRLGVVFLGAIAAVMIAHGIFASRPEPWVTSVLVGAAVFGGLSGFLLERFFMTLATAAIGAWLTVYAIAFFVIGTGSPAKIQNAVEEAATARILLICWLVLFLAGAVAQFATYPQKAKP